MKTQTQIELLLDEAKEMHNHSGMTYQEGVIAALEWVLEMMGESDNPID